MKHVDVAWVVVADKGGALCKRCGVTEEPPPLPIAIDSYVEWADSVLAYHAACKPRDEVPA